MSDAIVPTPKTEFTVNIYDPAVVKLVARNNASNRDRSFLVSLEDSSFPRTSLTNYRNIASQIVPFIPGKLKKKKDIANAVI